MFATRPGLPQLRSLASLSPSQINTATRSPFQVFDRHAKRLQKDRAAARDGGNRSRTVDYVRDEVANRMIERFMASVYSVRCSYDLAETDTRI
jgi:NADH dehydrogenase [ubiquinone] 1 alpha subcomplex assembly factor 5